MQPYRTPTSVVLRRVRRIVEGERASDVLSGDMPMSMIGILNLRANYAMTAEHLLDMLGLDGAIQYLNLEIAKACFRESGMVREQ